MIKTNIILNGKEINIKRNGNEYIALCPFHEEKTPSFTLKSDLKSYRCFGCGANGIVGLYHHPKANQKANAEFFRMMNGLVRDQ